MRQALPFSVLALVLACGSTPAVHAEDVIATASPVALSDLSAPRPPKVGEDTSLEALTRPDRFAWPARFICRPDPRRSEALVVVGGSFEELNETLAAADLFLDDCRGGFALESVTPQDGKLDRILGEVAGDEI